MQIPLLWLLSRNNLHIVHKSHPEKGGFCDKKIYLFVDFSHKVLYSICKVKSGRNAYIWNMDTFHRFPEITGKKLFGFFLLLLH